jgi:hypothetical protein
MPRAFACSPFDALCVEPFGTFSVPTDYSVCTASKRVTLLGRSVAKHPSEARVDTRSCSLCYLACTESARILRNVEQPGMYLATAAAATGINRSTSIRAVPALVL